MSLRISQIVCKDQLRLFRVSHVSRGSEFFFRPFLYRSFRMVKEATLSSYLFVHHKKTPVWQQNHWKKGMAVPPPSLAAQGVSAAKTQETRPIKHMVLVNIAGDEIRSKTGACQVGPQTHYKNGNIFRRLGWNCWFYLWYNTMVCGAPDGTCAKT